MKHLTITGKKMNPALNFFNTLSRMPEDFVVERIIDIKTIADSYKADMIKETKVDFTYKGSDDYDYEQEYKWFWNNQYGIPDRSVTLYFTRDEYWDLQILIEYRVNNKLRKKYQKF